MGLAEGTRIGPYQIVAGIGTGGMGEVYRARDTRLNRDVAIKILIPLLANDPDQLARFTQEAHILASLNHPHIAHIHGLEESDGIRALVMELVVGPTLADRLQSGPLPLAETLAVARQITDALASAHGHGIVHRDLKPANIKVRPDGTVKILDFGLAKAIEPLGTASSDTAAVITSPAVTRFGTILGTAAYMSPEQARGQAVDKRTDIWAFGCVLYEMLTSRRAFEGGTVSDTIAAVLGKNPDWHQLPRTTPPPIRRLLERTLEKQLLGRLHDIGDARIEIDDAIAGKETETPVPVKARAIWWWLATAAVAAIAAVSGYFALAPVGLIARPRYVPFASEWQQQFSPAWSPDGRSIAYVATVDDVGQLFVKSFDAAVPMQLTRSRSECRSPFWSPNGRRIFYGAEQKLWSISAAGGEPQSMIDDVAAATIAPDGAIAFIRGSGGKQQVWLAPPSAAPVAYRQAPFPVEFTRSNSIAFSPDGTKIAVLLEHQSGPALTFELWILPYPTGAPRRALAPFQSPTNPFNMGRVSWMSDNRQLVLQNTPPDEQSWHLHLVDTATGISRPISSGTGAEWTPAASPDGSRIAFASGLSDFDIVQVSIGSGETQPLLATGRNETAPSWSPSGTRFAYVTNMNGRPEVWLHSLPDDSSAPVLRRSMEGAPPWSTLERATFSPDGQRIAYGVIQSERHAIWISSVAGGRPVPIDSESVDQHGVAWSPDGNSLAYQRLRAGQWELVKVPLGGGAIVRIADGDPGAGPTAWSPVGDWLAYMRRGSLHLVSPDGSMDRVLPCPTPVAFTFSRDGRLMYVVYRDARRDWTLGAFDIGSGDQRKTQALQIPRGASVAGMSLHPDGRSFVTAVGAQRLDLWVLEGRFAPAVWWRSLLHLD